MCAVEAEVGSPKPKNTIWIFSLCLRHRKFPFSKCKTTLFNYVHKIIVKLFQIIVLAQHYPQGKLLTLDP